MRHPPNTRVLVPASVMVRDVGGEPVILIVFYFIGEGIDDLQPVVVFAES